MNNDTTSTLSGSNIERETCAQGHRQSRVMWTSFEDERSWRTEVSTTNTTLAMNDQWADKVYKNQVNSPWQTYGAHILKEDLNMFNING